jgi:hypothetical protein
MGPNGVVERIRSLLARFWENEESVVSGDRSEFRCALSGVPRGHEFLDTFEVEVERLTSLEAEVKRLRQRRAWLEEELLTRIEGHEPH